MTKRIVSVITVITMLCALLPLTSGAESKGTKYGDLYYTVKDDNTVTIVDCEDTAESITIPSEIDGMSVTAINGYAFEWCSSIKNVTIPDSVTHIGYHAFKDCTALTNITIPGSVEAISAYAFEFCTSLARVNIMSGVTSIETYAFTNCTALTDITIPDSVQSIGAAAFNFCISLKSAALPTGITTIDSSTFASCSALTNVGIPDSVKKIGYYAFSGCNLLSDVYYAGTEKQWSSVSKTKHNESLTNANIHYNSLLPKGGDYLPADINSVTINGHGTAYGYFLVLDTNGQPAKDKTVSYSVDGIIKPVKKTDENGILHIEINNITQSHDYAVRISGGGVSPAAETLSVKVKPLEYTSSYQASFLEGVGASGGIGAGASLGDLSAEAEVARIGADGSHERGFELSYKKEDGKDKIAISTTQNLTAALNGKAGLFADAGSKSFAYATVGAGGAHGKISYGSTLGVSYENDDFDIHNSNDVWDASLFLLDALLESCESNVAAKATAAFINPEITSFQSSNEILVSGGLEVGTLETSIGGVSADMTLAGAGVDTLYTYSWKTGIDNNTYQTSSVSANKGVNLFNTSIGGSKDETTVSPSFSVFSIENGCSFLEFGSENNSVGNLQSLSVSRRTSQSKGRFFKNTIDTNEETILFNDYMARFAAKTDENLNKFSEGDKGWFEYIQMKNANEKLMQSGARGDYAINRETKTGLDFDLSASIQLLLRIGIDYGLSGAESFKYENEYGIYDNNTYYIQSVSDIGTDAAKSFLSFEKIMSIFDEQISSILKSCWEVTKGILSDKIEAGKAKIQAIGSKAKNWFVSVTRPAQPAGTFTVQAVDDGLSLFSADMAITLGDPYIISVTDENGNEITDMTESPLMLTLEYDEDMLDGAGVTDENNIAIYHWDSDKCVYIIKGGDIDLKNKSVSLEITEPGQYILAIDSCPPEIAYFSASDGGSEPEITAFISDMSGIENFEFSIDDKTLVNNDNIDSHYNRASSKFAYQTENLTEGGHTAKITVSDSSGNSASGELEFTVSRDKPLISGVSRLNDTVNGEVTLSASVTGNDVSSVFMNIEERNSEGENIRSSVQMSENDGIYSASVYDIPEGTVVTAWISAYNTTGNSSVSEEQTVVSVSDAPALVISEAVNDTVTVDAYNCQDAAKGNVILAVYNESGVLENVFIKDYSYTVIFENIPVQNKKLKAMLWESVSSVTPLAISSALKAQIE